MRYSPINNVLFKRNREKLKTHLNDSGVAILYSNDEMPRNGDQFYPFRQSSDFYYLTGIEQELSILLLAPGSAEKKYCEILFIRKSNPELEIWEGHKLTKEEAREISGINTIYYIEEFESVLKLLLAEETDVYLNSNEYPKFLTEVESRDFRYGKQIREQYPLHNYQRLAPLMWDLRCMKEDLELKLMRKACDITKSAFINVLKNLRPGLKEYEVESVLTAEFIRHGGMGPAYPSIVASGINSCTLHYISNDKECRNGELLLMDFGAEYANYAADCSRTIPVNGKFTQRQKEVYNSVLKVFKQAKELFVPGNTIRIVNEKVILMIEKELILLGLTTKEEIKNQSSDNPVYMRYFMHGTSHFIGLDVHDPGSKDKVFEKGMVLTCEPGIYIKEEEIGIRIENDILVDDVPIDLMESIPLEIEEIEAIMNNN